MSGIAGCFYYCPQQSVLLERKILEMLTCMNAGGQQDTGLYSDNENIAFGFSNSNLINTASLCENDDYAVCFNGRLTNHKNLLLGDEGSGKSTAKLIIKLFEEKKEQITSLLEGIFSCIILEKRKKLFWILTDRCGYEFVYYYFDNQRFIFATEIKPILRILDCPPEVDMDGICNIYTFNTVFNTGTPFKNIKLMPHAAVCSVSIERVNINQYWDYPIDIEQHYKDEETLLSESRQLIQKAVDNASCGYDNIGVMLSGGLDSRLLASVAAENIKNIKAFTFNFGENKSLDNYVAKMIASQLNMEFCCLSLKSNHQVNEIEKCILDTDGHWAFYDQLSYIREIGKKHPGIALISGFLLDTLFKSGWAFFPGKFNGNFQNALEKRYCSIGDYLVDKLFVKEFADHIKEFKSKSVQETIGDLPCEKPAEVSLKFYCINRGRRGHNLAFKAFRKYLSVILPGTDYNLMDFAFKLSYGLRSNPEFYLKLICQWFPEIAQIPWDRTGKPLTDGIISKNPKKDQYFYKFKYYIQRLTRGKLDFLNAESGFNWRFRNDKKFQETMKEILFDQRTSSRGFFNQRRMDTLVKEHLAGKDYAAAFKAVISVEMLYRKFIDYDTRGY